MKLLLAIACFLCAVPLLPLPFDWRALIGMALVAGGGSLIGRMGKL